MQTTAIRTVANSFPENEVILLTLLISKRYILYTDLRKCFANAIADKYAQLFAELSRIEETGIYEKENDK